jgi:hypothetical protein
MCFFLLSKYIYIYIYIYIFQSLLITSLSLLLFLGDFHGGLNEKPDSITITRTRNFGAHIKEISFITFAYVTSNICQLQLAAVDRAWIFF